MTTSVKPAVALSALLVALLAGAIIGARVLLTAPIELPPPPQQPAVPFVVAPPQAPPRQLPAPPPLLPPPPPPQQQQQPQPPVAAAPLQLPRVPQPDDPADVDLSQAPVPPPSPQVEEALALVRNENTTAEQARGAAEVFVECLRTHPGDGHCMVGLKLAHRRQLSANLPSRQLLPGPGRSPRRPAVPDEPE
jgi:hypothetical protein